MINQSGKLPFVGMILLIALLLPASTPAGTICGTVRDKDTLYPINRAGIFVRTQEGTYTGYHGATDGTGNYCIDQIPAGTYDLEIAVNDYLTEYVRGVEVTDDVTNVDIDISDWEHYLYAPWPNPAQTSVTFRYRIGKPTPVKIQIFDVRGRIIRGWQGLYSTPGEHNFKWNLRDRRGARVPSGVYFYKLEAGRFTATRKMILLR